MPKKEFTGGTEDFGMIPQGARGHRAARHEYDELSDDELHADLQRRRGVSPPGSISEGSGDDNRTMGE